MPLVEVILALGALVVAAAAVPRRIGRGRGGVRRRDGPHPRLTRWERNVLSILRRQVPSGFHVCAQVRLADLLTIPGNDCGARTSALNRVACKSLDFVIVDLDSGRAILAIELDDRSHDRADRRDREALVEGVLRQVGVPLRRYRPRESINVVDILRQGAPPPGGLARTTSNERASRQGIR